MFSFPRHPRNLFMASVVVLIIALVLSATNVVAVLSAPLQVTVPSSIGFEGYLVDENGAAVADGAYDLAFKLWDAASAGAQIGSTETQTDVAVSGGLYSVVLTTFTANQFSGNRWLGVTATGGPTEVNSDEEIEPRTRITSVPFALNAQTASTADAVLWAGVSSKPPGFNDDTDNDVVGNLSCSTNQIAKRNDSTWICQADSGITGSGASGQVTTWNSSSTVTGSSGLTFASNNLSVSGGVNVGSATGAATGDLLYSGALKTYKNSTTYTAYAIVPRTSPLVNAHLDGDSVSAGTYIIDVDSTTALNGSTYGYSGPAGVRAIYIRMSAQWSVAGTTTNLQVRPTGAASAAVIARSQVANIVNDASGWVAVDSNGQFEFRIVGNNATNVVFEIWAFGL